MQDTTKNSDEIQAHENTRVGATVNSDTYLYGRTLLDIKAEPYETVLLAKLHLTKLLMHDLVHLDNMEDSKRISAVKKAEEFNRELLKEINYTDKDIKEALLILAATKDLNKVGSLQLTKALINNLHKSLDSITNFGKSVFDSLIRKDK